MRRHPCWLVGAGELSWIRPRSAGAPRCGTRKVVVSCRMQLNRKTDAETRRRRCRKASAWNSYGSLRSCPCSFGYLFCRTEVSAKAFFQPWASVRPPQVSLLLSAGREGTTVFFNNIMSQWPECKQKQRKSPDLFASKTAVGCVRGPAPDGNAVTCCDGTRKKKLLFP